MGLARSDTGHTFAGIRVNIPGMREKEAENYTELAAETRELARAVNDLFAKRTLLQIAQSYDMLAERAAEKTKAKDNDRSA
jgi:hypothetical protein